MEKIVSLSQLQKERVSAAKHAGEAIQKEIERLLTLHHKIGGKDFAALVELHSQISITDTTLDLITGKGINGDLHDKDWNNKTDHSSDYIARIDSEVEATLPETEEGKELDADSIDTIWSNLPSNLPDIDTPSQLVDKENVVLRGQVADTGAAILAIRIKLNRIAKQLQLDATNPYGPLATIHEQAIRINAKKPKLMSAS